MDRAAGWRRTERVLDEVGDDLEHPVRVADRRRSSSASASSSTSARAGLPLVPPDRLATDVGKVDLLVMDGELAPVHAREVEQVAHEPLEPPRFLANRRGRLFGVTAPSSSASA